MMCNLIPVPPKIEDSLSSGDKVRTEGSNVTLECMARGSPEPRITWRRQDGNNIDIDKSRNLSREYHFLHFDSDDVLVSVLVELGGRGVNGEVFGDCLPLVFAQLIDPSVGG